MNWLISAAHWLRKHVSVPARCALCPPGDMCEDCLGFWQVR